MFYHFSILLFKVILHQFWVKKICPWNINLEYGGTFTKLFMHVSSRNVFPTTRNLQIRVHVYRLRHCCGDFRLFCSDDCRSWPREEKLNNHGCFVSMHTFLTMIIKEPVCLQLFLCCTHGIYIQCIYIFCSSTEQCAWAIISPKEFKSRVTRISFALLYGKTELSVVKYFAICS